MTTAEGMKCASSRSDSGARDGKEHMVITTEKKEQMGTKYRGGLSVCWTCVVTCVEQWLSGRGKCCGRECMGGVGEGS